MVSLEMLLALGTLIPRDREVFVDHVLLDMSPSEIARRDGVSRSNIYNRIVRARARLAEQLA